MVGGAVSKHFRPMGGEVMENAEDLRFPVLVSPKIDGIRCVIRDGVPLSKRLKPIANKFIFAQLSGLPGFDGEITVASPTDTLGFDKTQSAVMSHGGEPAFTYHVFDHADYLTEPFRVRLQAALQAMNYGARSVRFLTHLMVHNVKELMEAEECFVAAGYEGLMIRDPEGPYKFGKATVKEAWLLKMIRRQRAEARVIGFVEKLHNTNEADVSELGLTKRSKKKAGMVRAGTLGALECEWFDQAKYGKAKFEIGTGTMLDAAKKQEIWDNQAYWKAAIINFEFRGITKDGKPRFPSAKGERYHDDMDRHPSEGEGHDGVGAHFAEGEAA